MLRSFSQSEREALVEEARDLYRSAYPETGERAKVRDTHACAFHAVSLQFVLMVHHGVRAMLQAGSCQWPMINPSDDDGSSATHFSYQWNGLTDPDTIKYVLNNTLPEVHVWLALKGGVEAVEDTILDPTSGTWPERARMAGREWTSPQPPAFLWHTRAELEALSERDFPLGILYKADLEACVTVDGLAALDLYPTLMSELRKRGLL